MPVKDAADRHQGGVDHNRTGEAPEMHVETRWLRRAAPGAAGLTGPCAPDGGIPAVSVATHTLSETDRGTGLTSRVAVTSFFGGERASSHRTGWTRAPDNLTEHQTEVS